MTLPLNGFPLIAQLPLFDGNRLPAGYVVVVDRGTEYRDRYVVAFTADPSLPTWHYSITYTVTLADALRAAYDRADVYVMSDYPYPV